MPQPLREGAAVRDRSIQVRSDRVVGVLGDVQTPPVGESMDRAPAAGAVVPAPLAGVLDGRGVQVQAVIPLDQLGTRGGAADQAWGDGGAGGPGLEITVPRPVTAEGQVLLEV